jgi:hypothetical protein
MIKAGLISGALMFLLVIIGAAGISPFCGLCAPFLAGLLAGYLTGVFEKPSSASAGKLGAGAGAIAGGIGLFASVIAAIINSLVLQNPQFQPNQFLGLPTASPATVWIGQILLNLCIGVVNIGLGAALGMGGAAIWFNTTGRNLNNPTSM